MIELKRSLTEQKNVTARLFHIELKGLIKRGLRIMALLPKPSIHPHNLENYNSRVLIGIRDDLCAHLRPSPGTKRSDRNARIVEQVMNFIILLGEGDEAWGLIIYKALMLIQQAKFKLEPEPRSEYWNKEAEHGQKEPGRN
uniref:Uncharacterized protein n=1 Tax=viral metagenome TaxID=1070528 RepID=A0A6M3IQC6_9ZZZZ